MGGECTVAAALIACRDNDKARANGVRALGNLLAFATFPADAPAADQTAGSNCDGTALCSQGRVLSPLNSTPSSRSYEANNGAMPVSTSSGSENNGQDKVTAPHEQQHCTGTCTADPWTSDLGNPIGSGPSKDSTLSYSQERSPGDWLQPAMVSLHSSLKNGAPKVQWNACYAACGLWQNPAVVASAATAPLLAPLLSLLIATLRDSTNFKVCGQDCLPWLPCYGTSNLMGYCSLLC